MCKTISIGNWAYFNKQLTQSKQTRDRIWTDFWVVKVWNTFVFI